jgi:hypothetical protein
MVVTDSRLGLAASVVEPRQVFKAALLANAASVIVVHNHPSGNPEPSRVIWRMFPGGDRISMFVVVR